MINECDEYMTDLLFRLGTGPAIPWKATRLVDCKNAARIWEVLFDLGGQQSSAEGILMRLIQLRFYFNQV